MGVHWSHRAQNGDALGLFNDRRLGELIAAMTRLRPVGRSRSGEGGAGFELAGLITAKSIDAQVSHVELPRQLVVNSVERGTQGSRRVESANRDMGDEGRGSVQGG